MHCHGRGSENENKTLCEGVGVLAIALKTRNSCDFWLMYAQVNGLQRWSHFWSQIKGVLNCDNEAKLPQLYNTGAG